LRVGVFAAGQSIPKVADLMGERASMEQYYDTGPKAGSEPAKGGNFYLLMATVWGMAVARADA
jgi:hypothetical protein